MAAPLNYAVDYSKELSQNYPYVLNFGALYASPNNTKYKITGANTIKIPSISTTGRVDSNKDTIATAARNYDNAWETKVLANQRKWSTLVHPDDIDKTNFVTSIGNITQVYNDEQKFPEMDAYCVSKIYADTVAAGGVAEVATLTEANVLTYFDKKMQEMDEARVPVQGRILYVVPAVKTLLKNASQVTRTITADSGNSGVINRAVNRLDEVEIVSVPSDLMKTLYNFTTGWVIGVGAKQIQMLLIHPLAVMTPVNYEFVTLDEPSGTTEGKYIYFEESYEDVFILNKKINAIKFITN